MSACIFLYIVVRYWRDIVSGCKRGWRGAKTYTWTCRVWVREADDLPWRELDAAYLRGLVTR